MSTITEIERAIEQLPASEVGALAAWLEVYRAGLEGSTSATSHAGQEKAFMRWAGSVEGPSNLSQRNGFAGE